MSGFYYMPVTFDGVGLLTFGFTWNAAAGYPVDGLGLETRGFVFLCGDIWTPGEPAFSSSWVKCDASTACG